MKRSFEAQGRRLLLPTLTTAAMIALAGCGSGDTGASEVIATLGGHGHADGAHGRSHHERHRRGHGHGKGHGHESTCECSDLGDLGPDVPYAYGDGSPGVDVGAEGETPDLDYPYDNECTACDPEAPPTDLKRFLSCFQSDLADWGVKLSVENGAVIGMNGVTYPLHAFASDFEKAVYLEVKDSERSAIIVRAYDEHIAPLVSCDADLAESIQWWILRYQRFFSASSGTIDEFVYDYPAQLSLYESLDPFGRAGEHFDAFRAFIEQVAHGYRDLAQFPAKDPGALPVVRIVTGPYGGGHVSVATTVNTSLAGTFDVATVNECDDFDGPLDIVTNDRWRQCRLYNDVQVKEGDPEKAALLAHLNWLLSSYIVPDQRGGLRRALLAAGTDMVFSTVHHLPDVTAVGTSFARPTLITITDYSFPEGQYFDVNHLRYPLAQYLIPTIQREFFRPLMLDYYDKSWEGRVGSARSAYIHDQLFGTTGASELTPAMLAELNVFNPIGFPVNAAMRPPTDPADVTSSRVALGLGTNANRKIVSVAFGSTGDVTRITALLAQLIDNASSIDSPIEIAVVSGGNADIIAAATAQFEAAGIPLDSSGETGAAPLPDRITAKVFARLTQEEIAELYRATDAYVSKAGGATTAELIASSTPFVRGFALDAWEYENAVWMTKLGLSTEMPPASTSPLDVDLSYLGQAPSTDLLVSEINDTFAAGRFFGPIPGAYRYSVADLVAIVNGVLARNPAPQLIPTATAATVAAKPTNAPTTKPCSKKHHESKRGRHAHL